MEFNDNNIPIIDKDNERERMEKMSPFLVVDFLRTQVSGTKQIIDDLEEKIKTINPASTEELECLDNYFYELQGRLDEERKTARTLKAQVIIQTREIAELKA